MERINTFAVNRMSLVQIAEDWGVEVYPRGERYAILCPNPNHNDTHLGNCFITENGDRNCFHCFACGAGGGPVHFIMYLENCDYSTAQYKIALKYGLFLNGKNHKKEEPSVGLSYDEYKTIGLKNACIKIPVGIDENGNTVYSYKRYTLKDLAKDDPEIHKTIVTGKIEETIQGYITFLSYLKEGKIKGVKPDKEWEKICKERINYFSELSKKVVAV